MVHLRDGIYCQESAYDHAKGGGTTLASHVARRRMDGVFIPEVLMKSKCTLRGWQHEPMGKKDN